MKLNISAGLNFSRAEIASKNFIHENPGNHHCIICSSNGAKIARYWIAYNYINGSPNNWLKTFPCWESLIDYMTPLNILEAVNIIGYGKVTD